VEFQSKIIFAQIAVTLTIIRITRYKTFVPKSDYCTPLIIGTVTMKQRPKGSGVRHNSTVSHIYSVLS